MDLKQEFTRLQQNGQYYTATGLFNQKFAPKPGSHDDGPGGGPFYGGIGAPAFSRSLTGSFNRWHLQPGYHACRDIRSAALLLWWHEQETEPECRVLSLHGLGVKGIHPWKPQEMETTVLFPFTIEHYAAEDLPVEVLVRFFSPVVAKDLVASSLPVVYIDVEIHNRTETELEASVALFWPNQLGWRQPLDASEHMTVCSWPARGNYGNINLPIAGDRSKGVVQTRNPQLSVKRDLEGEVLVLTYSHRSGQNQMHITREITFKTEPNGTGGEPESQAFTFPWAAASFSKNGDLPETEESFPARCHEGIGSAVAQRIQLAPQCQEKLHFMLVHDLPKVEFGGGRVWDRAYCEHFGEDGHNSVRIGSFAIEHKADWLQYIKNWQEEILKLLDKERIRTQQISTVLINDLYFLVAGGTAWVSATTDYKIRLKNKSHFALLEGFDTGYYYYNTFDLWVYAFPALLAGWPSLAESVFTDYLRTVDLYDDSTRIIYRQAEQRPVLKPGKIPHDIGSAMEDPWHDLNAYSWRDDPNMWRDHNPAFITSFYFFRKCTGKRITKAEWLVLERALQFMLLQDSDGDGLPEHREFGDSTWDALCISGIGAYSGALAIAALASMVRITADFDTEKAAAYNRMLVDAVTAFQHELWNGRYFRNSSRGKYKDAIQADALFGLYLADLAGLRQEFELGTLGAYIPLDRIRSHLRTVYEYNFLGYEKGRVGPLLITNPELTEYSRDGGEDLQLGEVIVGSAWAYAAMLDYYGLKNEASEVEFSLAKTLYRDSGLQFRTPAAWDGKGFFRAPLNMRPLASWFFILRQNREQ